MKEQDMKKQLKSIGDPIGDAFRDGFPLMHKHLGLGKPNPEKLVKLDGRIDEILLKEEKEVLRKIEQEIARKKARTIQPTEAIEILKKRGQSSLLKIKDLEKSIIYTHHNLIRQ